MADTLTPNYGWVKPEVGASAATWGAKQNGVFDQIDAQVFANQQAGVPVGSGALWFTVTPPANWLICNGASLDTTTYAALFAVIGYTFGGSGANFLLPNLAGRFPQGAGTLAATGGEATHLLTAAEIPAHAHPITDVAHNHGVNQSPHAHGDPGHTHGASAGDSGAHVHGANLMRFVGAGGTFGVGSAPFNVLPGNTDAANAPGVNVTVNAAGTGLQAANANISLNASGTGLSTTRNTGGGGAHNNLPPFLSINFIVRYQ